jgi:hypothetical protein
VRTNSLQSDSSQCCAVVDEFPKKHFKEFLKYCDMSEEHFWDVIDSWRSDHLWKKVNGQWKLKYQVE